MDHGHSYQYELLVYKNTKIIIINTVLLLLLLVNRSSRVQRLCSFSKKTKKHIHFLYWGTDLMITYKPLKTDRL